MTDWITTKEVAEHLGVSVPTIRRLLAENDIPASKASGQWRFSRQAIDEWMTTRNRKQLRGSKND